MHARPAYGVSDRSDRPAARSQVRLSSMRSPVTRPPRHRDGTQQELASWRAQRWERFGQLTLDRPRVSGCKHAARPVGYSGGMRSSLPLPFGSLWCEQSLAFSHRGAHRGLYTDWVPKRTHQPSCESRLIVQLVCRVRPEDFFNTARVPRSAERSSLHRDLETRRAGPRARAVLHFIFPFFRFFIILRIMLRIGIPTRG